MKKCKRGHEMISPIIQKRGDNQFNICRLCVNERQKVYKKSENQHKKEKARELAKKMYPELKNCELCGSDKSINRHHEDYNKLLEIIFLCRICHIKRHKERGDWGYGPKKSKPCIICNKYFFPKENHHKLKTCSSICYKELARFYANKRWTKT